MKRASLCSISKNVSAPCEKCGKLQRPEPWPVHICQVGQLQSSPPKPRLVFYCADCCKCACKFVYSPNCRTCGADRRGIHG